LQVEEFLERSARRYGAKTALVSGERRLSYDELDQQCNRLACALIAQGVERGDRVLVQLENSIEAVRAIFAILKAGAVFVMVNPTAKAEKLKYIIGNCSAAALITHAEKFKAVPDYFRLQSLKAVFLAGRGAHQHQPGDLRAAWLEDLEPRDATRCDAPPKRCIDVDLAALVYTSGSTGMPKSVMTTHLNMVSSATSIVTYLGNTPDDIILSVLPLSFGYGLYQILTAFKAGATVVLERSFTYPAATLDRLMREKVTGFPIIPTVSALLLQMNLEKWDFSCLRYITNAGAAIPADHISKLRRLLPRVKIYSMYGLAECSTRASYLPPDQIDVRPTSVGKGIPNEEAYIVNEQGNRVGPGVVGELVVRGSNVMKGYWGMPEETDKVLRPGPFPWEKVLHTGDLFKMDEEGYLYFVARKDDLIKSRGEKISPREIEEALHSLGGVAEAAVVGVPDPILGTAIKAVIVRQQNARLTAQDVLRHCAKHLEDFMVPKFVEFREDLPRTPTGKIAKRLLFGQPEAVS
jgi:amino acid adenylation domain-containing protein